MKRAVGWLLVVLGCLWAVIVFIKAPPAGPDGLGLSQLFGAITIPILVTLLGLYFAGMIKNAK